MTFEGAVLNCSDILGRFWASRQQRAIGSRGKFALSAFAFLPVAAGAALGSLAVVYKAEDVHRFLALKFLPDESPRTHVLLPASDARYKWILR